MKKKFTIEGDKYIWEAVIGMEVHAQVSSNSKLFSGASTDFGGDPNHHVSLVDVAFPGMLPVINGYCIDQAIRTGLALGAQINLYSVFDRKNYFYPDLPQGYQISQFKYPIVGEGVIQVHNTDEDVFSVGIERIHLEQDAGKNIHDLSPDKSYIDLNRSGVALMEIVTKPDIRSSEQAKSFFSKLRTILRYIGTCDGNMEQGSMRADINISVRRPGDPLGTRCEVKNVNSFRFIGQAIEYEIQRQIGILEDGGHIIQETRLYDTKTGETRSMRGKEEAQDYRYFPDPDLLPLRLSQQHVDELKKGLPELPDDKHERLVHTYGISHYEAAILVEDPKAAIYFEDVAQKSSHKLAISWVIGELFGALNKSKKTIDACPVSTENMASLLSLIDNGTISGRTAKDVFAKMFETGEEPTRIVDREGLQQVSDTSAIEDVIDTIIANNPEKVAQLKEKPKLRGWFIGQIMQQTGGRANPQLVNDLLDTKLAQ